VYDAPRPQRAPTREPAVRTSPSTAGWIALAIWAVFVVLALLATVGAVGAFSRFTSGLERPTDDLLNKITFSQQSVIVDRNGVELARFGGEKREPVAFADIPPIVVDAQVAVEDKTFWDNAGFDPLAILSAGIDSLRGNSRGASTITQQLVRQRLLDPKLVQDPSRTLERKIKEIVQSIRLTAAFPGVEGKQKIIAAYLNQNYYGNQTYGVKAAAETYFGHPLAEVTPAEAAILAGLVKSPSNYDLVRNAVANCDQPDANDPEKCLGKTTLEVPDDAPIVVRRNQILDLLASGRTVLSGDQYSPAQLTAAKSDPVIVAPQTVPRWIAPHFVWAVLQELGDKVCGVDVPTCDALEAGGLTVTTTLDTKIQAIAERWVQAAAVVPNSKNPAATAKALKLPYAAWMKNLRGKDINNGALVAIDYQTGELIAYVGSANYYAAKSTPQFQAKYDVVGSGYRQPGSAFKPFNYLTAIDDKKLTAGSMLMDTATDFGGNYTPSDADNLERGPVRVRTALQFSLNIPSVKAAQINSPDHVFARSKDFGMVFQTDTTNAGMSIALGVQEVRPVDLVTAYATLANGGRKLGHTTILSVHDQSGSSVNGIADYVPPAGDQVASPQAAWIVTDILSGNTNPKVNPFWGKFALTGPDKARRPATLKTGTNNDAKDLNAYGFIAPPTEAGRAKGEYALAVGAWNGNSDNTVVSTPQKPVFSIDVTTYVWQGFLQEATKSWEVNDFAQPDGLTQAKIDPFTGLRPQSGGKSIDEWFIAGTEPKDTIPEGACGQAVLDSPGIYEHNYSNWMTADLDWLNRAKRGPGTSGGVNKTRTAYFYNGAFQPFGRSWGALVEGHGCSAPSPSVTCYPVPTPDASGVIPSFVVPSADPSSNIVYEPCATPSSLPSESPSVEPSVDVSSPPSEPAVTPTPTAAPPTPTPTPAPTPPPTPAPTPPPTPGPSAAAQPSGAP
jgi:peptidoglycan glycosyltransferase